MREVNRRSIKKRIFTVAGIIATCMLCVGIAVAMFTKADAATKLPDEVTYGKNTYSKTNPLVVLEILPHEAYDELGPLISNNEGTYKWDELVAAAPKGEANKTAMENYQTSTLSKYCNYLNAIVSIDYNTKLGHKMCYKNLKTGDIYDHTWSVPLSEIEYDYTNVKPILCTWEGDSYYEEMFESVDADAEWASIIAAAPSGKDNVSAMQSYLNSTISTYYGQITKQFGNDSCKVVYKCTDPTATQNSSTYYDNIGNFSWNPQCFNYDLNNVSIVLREKVTAEDGTTSYVDVEDGFKYVSIWNAIAAAAPSGEANAEALREYINTTVNKYCKTYYSAVKSDYVMCFIDDDKNRFENKYENTGVFSVDLATIGYDLKNLTPVICKKHNGGYYKPVNDDLNVRNFFAYMVFGEIDMEDKIKIIPKAAKDVTVADIDNADLVYISSKSHNTELLTYYNAKNGTNYSSTWLYELGGNDISAEVAMRLQMASVLERKALILNSEDLNTTTDSNVTRLCKLQAGLDADTFVRDFAFEEVTYNKKYKGNRGEFRIENGGIELYLDVDTHYTSMGYTITKPVGLRKMPWQNDMFINSGVISTNVSNDVADNSGATSYGYALMGNSTSMYPTYNVGGKNDFLTKSTFIFNSNNGMTNMFSTQNAWRSDYVNGVYQGSSYSDALLKLEIMKSDLNTPSVIKYILGAFGGGLPMDIDGDGSYDLRVLEIEPAGTYRYSNDSIADKKIIAEFFGYYDCVIKGDTSVKDTSGKIVLDIQIDNISMNGFNGLNVDIRSEYDLVILGAYDNGDIKTSVKYYAESNSDTDDKIYNNDLTEKAYNKLLDYICADMPMVLDRTLYYGQTSVAAAGTYVNKINITDIGLAIYNKYGREEVVNVVPATISATTADNLRTVTYISRPNVTIRPAGVADYDGDNITNNMFVEKKDLANLAFSGTVSNTEFFRMKIYVDRDCDSMFSEDYESDESELMFFCINDNSEPVYNKAGVIKGAPFTTDTSKLGVERANVNADKITYTSTTDEDGNITWDVTINMGLPEALNGYMGWKVEIIDESTGRTNVSKGAFAVKSGVSKTVEVIQIVNDGVASNIDLKGKAFTDAFAATTPITGLGLNVDVYTKSAFNAVADKKALLDNYSMIVLGLSDNYGVSGGDLIIQESPLITSGDLTNDSLDAINAYIDNGKSVLFTHDSLSYKYKYKDTKGVVQEQAAGSYGNLNAFTQKFQTVIGMQGGYRLTEPLWTKSNNYSLFNSINSTSTTRITDKVSRLNKGEITQYPYTIKGTGSKGTITVADTHAQYFKLNLEDLKELVDGKQKDVDDVVVWYTLEQSSSNTVAKTHYKTENGKKVFDHYEYMSEISPYFAATGQDAINNYYVYSMGNITYSSAGHSLIGETQTEELQLFVNTFVRAILSGNSKPEVSYENAVQDSEYVYSQFYRGQYYTLGDSIPHNFDYTTIPTQFKYTITDPDLASGAGRISQARMFYDKNGNDVFDEGTDVWLCYIGYSGTVPTYTPDVPSGKSVVSGVSYDAKLWEILDNVGVAEATQNEMANKLIKNELRIGIVATDSRNAKGYGILKFVQRELHKLD